MTSSGAFLLQQRRYVIKAFNSDDLIGIERTANMRLNCEDQAQMGEAVPLLRCAQSRVIG